MISVVPSVAVMLVAYTLVGGMIAPILILAAVSLVSLLLLRRRLVSSSL